MGSIFLICHCCLCSHPSVLTPIEKHYPHGLRVKKKKKKLTNALYAALFVVWSVDVQAEGSSLSRNA